MTDSPCDIEHICPICEKVVPKKEVFPMGIRKLVQPRCHCEVDHFERGINEASERKIKNDIERKFGFAALGERFENSKFSTFTVRDGAEKACRIASDYANQFPELDGESILFWGTTGNGKSHLAAGVCHVVKQKGFIAVFQSIPELLERIRSTFRSKNKESEREIMEALRQCDLLVLDDIGSEKVSDWVLDVLFRIIDGRYRAKKPTMFTTNFSPTELLYRFMPENPTTENQVAAKRIHDRIIEVSVIIENKASSYRLETAQNRRKQDPEGKRRWWND